MKEKIVKLIDSTVGSQLSNKIEVLGENTNMFDNGLDSIGFINIVIAIENEFDFFIDQDDLDQEIFSSVNRITEYVEKRLKEQ